MAEDCADDDDDRATIAALRKAILQELNLHASVLEVLFFCCQSSLLPALLSHG
jgi:hypothetical protein